MRSWELGARYVIRVIIASTLLFLVLYGLDFLIPAAARMPSSLSTLSVAFMLGAFPSRGELRVLPAVVARRLVAPLAGIGLAQWLVVGVGDLVGSAHSDGVLAVGVGCLAATVLSTWLRARREKRAREGQGDGGTPGPPEGNP
jgi:hypothetical protein